MVGEKDNNSNTGINNSINPNNNNSPIRNNNSSQTKIITNEIHQQGSSNTPINISIKERFGNMKNNLDLKIFFGKLIVFLIILYFIFFTKLVTEPLFSFIRFISENILNNFVGIESTFMILMINILVFFVIGNILYFSFPYGRLEKKIEFLKKQFIFLIIILVAIASYANLTYNTTDPTEKIEKEINKSSSIFVKNINDFFCYFNPTCVINKTTVKESSQTTREYRDISFQTPYLNNIEIKYEDISKKPLVLNYDFENIEKFKVLKINCYQDKVEDKNMFYSKKLDLDSQDPNFYSKLNKEIICDFKNFKNKPDDEVYETTIYPILSLEFNEINKIEIPITFQDLIYDKIKNRFPQITKPIEYPNNFVYKYMIDRGFDVQITSQDLVNSRLLNIKNRIPLVYGNNVDEEVPLHIELYKNSYSSLGEIKDVKIENIKVDEKYLNIINKEILKSNSDVGDDKLYVINLILKENDNQDFSNVLSEFLYTPINLNLKINSTLQNSFKIYINNRDIKKEKN